MTPGLLVSVREAGEAALACIGGASLIDVKEPSRGALGRADDATITAVVHQIAGRLPVSAALGELREGTVLTWGWEKLSFLKWGLSGCAGKDWQSVLRQRAERVGSRVVNVAYADSDRAAAPAVAEVVDFACGRPWPDPVLLIDTFDKSRTAGRRRTLLDWLPLEKLTNAIDRCHAAGVRVALAGSLGIDEIRQIVPLAPDWIGVRGAVCDGADRQARLNPARVMEIQRILGEPEARSVPES